MPCQPGGRAGALSGVVQHDDLGGEVGDTSGRLVLGALRLSQASKLPEQTKTGATLEKGGWRQVLLAGAHLNPAKIGAKTTPLFYKKTK